MLNFSKLQAVIDEILSLAKSAGVQDNSRLSQNLLAVSQTAQNGFFCVHSSTNTPHFNHAPNSVRLPVMGRLIPQNKPIGEYGERLLTEPRVRPSHPITGFSTQNQLLGAFQC